jgi:hypothetical protein
MDMISAMEHDGLIGAREEITLLRQLQKNFEAAKKLYTTAGIFPRKHIEFARKKLERLDKEQRLVILRLIRNKLKDPDDWNFAADAVRSLIDIKELPNGGAWETIQNNTTWPKGRFWPQPELIDGQGKSRTAYLLKNHPGCDAAFLRRNGGNAKTLYKYIQDELVIQETYDNSDCATEWSRLVPDDN